MWHLPLFMKQGRFRFPYNLGVATEKAVFYNRKTLHQETDLNVRRKLVNCYIGSIVLYAAENWTVRKLEHKYLESLKNGPGGEWRG